MHQKRKKQREDVYLVSISIFEGRHYAWPNMDSYVHTRVGTHAKCSKVKYGTDCPYYNEFYVFEYRTRLQELLDTHVTLTVFRPRKIWRRRKCLGYVTLDVATIWNQTDHQFFRKWAVLSSSGKDFNGPRGYLKVTLSVLAKGESPPVPVVDPLLEDEIEGNLLLPDGLTLERQRCQYIFKVYNGADLSKGVYPIKNLKDHERKITKCKLHITFAGLTGKTSKQSRSSFPVWNEILTLNELFPPLCQRVKLQLFFKDSGRKVRAVKYLNIYSIANDQEGGFLPTFGPAYIFFYEEDSLFNDEHYVGKLLLSFETKLCLDGNSAPKGVVKEKVGGIVESDFWKYEEVVLFSSIFDVTLINRRYTKQSVHFDISFGNPFMKTEATSEGQNLLITPPKQPLSKTKQFWYLPLNTEKPCLKISSSFPDLRRRLYNSNMIANIVSDFQKRLDEIERLFVVEEFRIENSDIENKLIDMFDNIAAACRKYIDISSAILEENFVTFLDHEKAKLCLREMEEIEYLAQVVYNPKLKKKCLRKAQKMCHRLNRLIDHPQACWPDIFLTMFHGGKKVATEKLEAKDFVYSLIDEECGLHCGNVHNLFFRLNKRFKNTSPFACKVTTMIWIGLQSHREYCFQAIPRGYSLNSDIALPSVLIVTEQHKFQCRAHIYQGRFQQAYDDTGLSDLFSRVSLVEQFLITKTKKATLNPVWDQMLHFQCFAVFGTAQHIKANPPLVVIELIDRDKCCQNEFVGRGMLRPVVKLLNEEYVLPNFPPKLQWIDIQHDTGIAGQVLVAVELLELSGDTLEIPFKPNMNSPVLPIPDDIKPVLVPYRLEVFLWGVRQLKKCEVLPVCRPKLVIECAGQTLQSETLPNARRDMNFSQPIKSIDLELPSIEELIPPVTITMFECRGLRNIYLGCSLTYLQQFIYHPISIKEYNRRISGMNLKSYDSFDSHAPSEELVKTIDFPGGDDLHNQNVNATKNINTDQINISTLPAIQETVLLEQCESCNVMSHDFIVAQADVVPIKENPVPLKSEEIAIKPSPPKANMNHKLTQPVIISIPESGDQKAPTKLSKQHLLNTIKSIWKPSETEEEKPPPEEDLPTDWWAKYYASSEKSEDESRRNSRPNFKLKFYNNELEKQSEFRGFNDLYYNFGIYRGKRTGDDTVDDEFKKAAVKCAIKLFRWPPEGVITSSLSTPSPLTFVNPLGQKLENGYFQHYPANDPHRSFLLRVYCVKGIKLRPLDRSGKCDPYLCVRMGRQKVNDKSNYIAKQTSPIFGKLFEFKGMFPQDTRVTVQVWDWDRTSRNDMIGETQIDFEDRYYSRHRANCGLQYEYPEQPDSNWFWRDQINPTKILEEKCRGCNLPPPVYEDDNVVVGCKTFSRIRLPNEKYGKENLALHALHNFHEVPVVGHHLVPEHVETRSLCHPAKPGLEQGKLQMWLDIFPLGDNPPPKAVDISPRKPQPHELRIIVHNTEEIPLKDDNFLLGERMSDIYVKAWLAEPSRAQTTDIHYRSLTGEGNFNWRFVFPFDYLPSEDKIVVKKKEHLFEIDETEMKVPCRLKLQVWDNDTFTSDDFIGFLTMDLSKMHRGSKFSRHCTLKLVEPNAPTMNLFKAKQTKGWWPFKSIDKKTNEFEYAGKLEAEFYLLTGDEASADPAGLGRDDPQALEPPNRPNTSFAWFKNPLKSCRFIVCRYYKWKLIIGLIVAMIVMMILLMIYAFPGYSVKKLLGA